MSMKKYSDEQLFQLLRQGDRTAFEELYHRYKRPLIVYTLRKVEQKSAEDLNHDLWISLWEKRELIQLKGSVIAYLFKAIRNRMIDYMAKSVHLETYLDTIQQSSVLYRTDRADDLLREKMFLEKMEALLNAHGVRSQVIMKLRMQGYNNHEIADKLNISEKTVRNQYSSILKYLRAKIHKLLHLLLLFSVFGMPLLLPLK